jgi:AcrR family transcriptional regulator
VATERRRQIADAARELLDTEGPGGLTVARIAERLGIKAPSLYKHVAGKREIEALLIADGLQASLEALEPAGEDPAALAAAYRAFALAQPALYRLMTDGPLPRDLLPEGLEDRAAAPVLRAFGGDEDLARAAWGTVHGLVSLELAGRFPADADLDAAWAAATGLLRSATAGTA